MKRHIASLLIVASCFAAAYALGGVGASTDIITSATLTINVGDARFMEIYNFTQTGATSPRGVVIVGIFPSPTPTPTPTATPTPTPTPTLSTMAGGSVVVGSADKLTDTAILFGDNSPTGTITFTLQDPSNTTVDTEMVTVTGNGNYDTPTGFTPSATAATGTYMWSATYGGDSNNSPATDNGQNESETVFAPTPTPTPVFTNALTATIIDSKAPPEFIKPVIIQGPAVVTIEPVSDATLSITYRKFAEPTPSSTASPTATVSSSTSTSASTITGTANSGTVTIMESAAFDDDMDSTTPTPTPATPPASMSTPTPTPTATPSETPTPSPTAIPTP